MKFLPWNISWNISKISRCFFRLYTRPFNIFLYVKHYLSFIYAYCSSLSLSAGLLAWFACLSTGSKLALSIDYYDVRRTRYSPVAVTEVKDGSVSSTGSSQSINQSIGMLLKRWMLLNKWTTDNIDQNTPNTNKNKQIGRYPVLVVFNRFYYKCTSKESIIFQ